MIPRKQAVTRPLHTFRQYCTYYSIPRCSFASAPISLGQGSLGELQPPGHSGFRSDITLLSLLTELISRSRPTASCSSVKPRSTYSSIIPHPQTGPPVRLLPPTINFTRRRATASTSTSCAAGELELKRPRQTTSPVPAALEHFLGDEIVYLTSRPLDGLSFERKGRTLSRRRRSSSRAT